MSDLARASAIAWVFDALLAADMYDERLALAATRLKRVSTADLLALQSAHPGKQVAFLLSLTGRNEETAVLLEATPNTITIYDAEAAPSMYIMTFRNSTHFNEWMSTAGFRFGALFKAEEDDASPNAIIEAVTLFDELEHLATNRSHHRPVPDHMRSFEAQLRKAISTDATGGNAIITGSHKSSVVGDEDVEVIPRKATARQPDLVDKHVKATMAEDVKPKATRPVRAQCGRLDVQCRGRAIDRSRCMATRPCKFLPL